MWRSGPSRVPRKHVYSTTRTCTRCACVTGANNSVGSLLKVPPGATEVSAAARINRMCKCWAWRTSEGLTHIHTHPQLRYGRSNITWGGGSSDNVLPAQMSFIIIPSLPRCTRMQDVAMSAYERRQDTQVTWRAGWQERWNWGGSYANRSERLKVKQSTFHRYSNSLYTCGRQVGSVWEEKNLGRERERRERGRERLWLASWWAFSSCSFCQPITLRRSTVKVSEEEKWATPAQAHMQQYKFSVYTYRGRHELLPRVLLVDKIY